MPEPGAIPESGAPALTGVRGAADGGIAVSQVNPLRRLRLHAGYQWRNSGNPLLTGLRTQWESRDGAEFPAVVSRMRGMSVAYAGLPEGLRYTLEFTELQREKWGGPAAERADGTVRGHQLADPAQLPDADIVIVGTSAAKARQLPSAASLVFPMRFHFVVDIDEDAESLHKRISKRERAQYLRNQRLAQWTWETEDDPGLFDFFYDRIYRPTMWQSHGDRERVEEKEASYECLFRTGRLFFLSQGGERIGGALCHWNASAKVMTLRLFGVLDGDKKHYNSGALGAIFHFLIMWSADNGVRRLDFGGTEPFLSKGTFQWKRRFGTRIVLPPNHFGEKRLWLQVKRDSPAVRDFLVANPILAEADDGSMEAVYFHDQDRPARVELSAKSPDGYRVRHVELDEFLR
ncbi:MULTISPECIES: hypothetical protein [unclassified Streptomyces]|uniref:hypothetical protein n=1 Tax=unclassified Streptomyces TaxID=2593676 RepID=UPI0036EFC2BB